MNPNDTAPTTTPEPQIEAYFEGVVDRGSQKKVAVAVNVNFELKDGQKERGHSIPIHVIPLIRRMHPNGVVIVKAKWARNIPRTVELTQEELKSELEGLARSYGQKMPGQMASYLAEVYGATEVDQIKNLHAKMGQVWHAWLKLEEIGRKRVKEKFPRDNFSTYALHGVIGDVLTDDEMAELVHIIEPEQEQLAAIQLPDLADIRDGITNEDSSEKPTEIDAIEWLTTELENQLKMPTRDAISLTAHIVESEGVDPDAARLTQYKCLQKSDGTLHGNRATAVLRAVAQYRKLAAAAPATA